MVSITKRNLRTYLACLRREQKKIERRADNLQRKLIEDYKIDNLDDMRCVIEQLKADVIFNNKNAVLDA